MIPPSVLVVGSSNTDLIVQADRLPDSGETVLGGDLVISPGGKGANQAVGAARLGAKVSFVARVGNDMFGQEALANLEKEGVDLGFVVRDPETPSGVALIVLDKHGRNLIAVAQGANRTLAPADVIAARPAFDRSHVVLIQLEIPLETVGVAAQTGREAGAKVILNPAPAATLPEDLFDFVDILTPNEKEAKLLSGKDSPEDGAKALLEKGLEGVAVTLGEAGILFGSSTDPIERFPGFSVKAVDTTGAGDAFNAALAVGLSRGDAMCEALRFAQAATALTVTRLGAQPSLPDSAEVERFLKTSD